MTVLAWLIALAAVPTTTPAQAPARVAPLTVAVGGVESSQGLVHVDICTERTFLKTCRWAIDVPAVAGTTTIVIPALPPGRYAAQGTHDRNGDRKVNRNLLGIPTERVGFSNNAPIRFGPPKFAAAAFEHGTTPQRIAFDVRRLP